MIGREHQNPSVAVFVLALLGLPGVGARTLQRVLLEHRKRILAADALDERLACALGVPAITRALEQPGVPWPVLEEGAERTIERAGRAGILVLTPYDADYPQRLLRHARFPPALFARGDPACLNPERAVAIVGTRQPAPLSLRMGRRLAEVLAERDYLVVSGLAIGCDAAAHEGALAAGGRTLAVLPTPLDEPVYPAQNQHLAERILEHGGMLVSECAPGTHARDQLAASLVTRDEWQSALADGIVAIETGVRGGTTHALEHARARGVPIAALDLRTHAKVDFLGDARFGGNVACLTSGEAMSICDRASIAAFEQRMAAFRTSTENVLLDPPAQLSLPL